jgi:hypothetical protein
MKIHVKFGVLLDQELEFLDDRTECFGFTFRGSNYLELFVDPSFEDILILR